MTRLYSFRVLGLALVAFFFTFAACDSGGANEDEEINNEFTLDVTPTSDTESATSKVDPKSINGFSFFVDASDIEEVEEEQVFAIYFSDVESEDEFAGQATQGLFGFLVRASDRPEETTTYNLMDAQQASGPSSSDFLGWVYEDVSTLSSQDNLAPFYAFQGGTVTLTTSNSNEVAGEIDATAISFSLDTSGDVPQVVEEEVEITGSFKAKNITEFVAFDQFTDSPF